MLRKTEKNEFKFYKYDYFRNFVYTPIEYEGLFLMSGSSKFTTTRLKVKYVNRYIQKNLF